MECTGLQPGDGDEDGFTCGVNLYSQGDYTEAAKLFRVALETREGTLCKDHPEIMECKFWLGRALYKQRLYGEACWHLQQAVEGQVLGSNGYSERTLEYKFWFARAALEHEDYIEAAVTFHEVVEGWERLFGRSDQRTLESRFWQGKTFYSEQSYRDAEWVLRLAADGQEILLGKDHEVTLQSKSYLAFTLDKKKEYGSAQALLQQVEEGLEESQCTDYEWARAVVRLLSEYRQRKLNTSVPESVNSTSFPENANIKDHNLSRQLGNSIFSGDPTTQEPYTDLQIQKVALLLRHFKPQWSKVPRTYVLLRTIGQLSVLDQLISNGFSDYMFPITEKCSPKFLEPRVRVALLNVQQLILTRSKDLERGEEGGHCRFGKGDHFPFEEVRLLGKGAYGEVHLVRSLLSFKEYARKRVPRGLVFDKHQRDSLNKFVAEIQILKRLKHHHIVRFVGSYTDPRYIGLLMSPVALTDLRTYMQNATSSDYPHLRTSFGCLAKALEFLHSQKIRHKDIKPANILIDNVGKVLFTDFGLSFDFTDATGSTTIGMTREGTPRYRAPEVAHSEPRNTKADIWSLGIVFVEMILTLKGRTTEYMDAFFSHHGSTRTFIGENIAALPNFITELRATGIVSDNRPLGWIQEMLALDQKGRPDASSLVEKIITGVDRDEERRGFCCDECLYPAEDSSDEAD